ncbi:hypothetical protein RM717_34395 [Streptomyces griseus]|uniref:Uncharacterized protein n=1 Tax=Streptomyces stephensoniae TaxID=3375367 RepID=A0ABU2WER0_9ACTN|nr:hypothetical protein [Streptomyces griseus]MDT0495582.1 hypothetical protein [Streptomyces griseus]
MEPISPQVHPQQRSGAMVGLFWIGAEAIHLGMPPVAPAPGVTITPEGLRITGADPLRWTWSGLSAVRVTEAPVRSTVTRWASRAASFVAAALNAWTPGSPAEMTVVVTARNDEIRTPVHSGASSAYTQREVDLSHALLARFVQGTCSPAVLSDWQEEAQPTGTPNSRQREALLHSWLSAG